MTEEKSPPSSTQGKNGFDHELVEVEGRCRVELQVARNHQPTGLAAMSSRISPWFRGTLIGSRRLRNQEVPS